jgi:uncharacterized integral membrane protein (TIGR00698 family)
LREIDMALLPKKKPITSSAYYASLDSMEGLEEIERRPVPAGFERFPRAKLLHAIYPGVLVAATIALAATFLSLHYGAPVMLFALLLGMAFHFLHEEGRCIAGIEFCSRTILRIGVGLLGVRITAAEIAGLGIGPILTILAGVATTILVGTLLAQRMRLGTLFGILSGGAVAICGASAALAISTALPDHRDKERDTILVVVAVTTLSTIAMVIYPLLVASLGLDHVHAGIFLGGTIHDVAQVVGAGYMISQQTGDIATYIKLLRVATLIPVVLTISVILVRSAAGGPSRAGKRPALPLFLIGFAALVVLNSVLTLPPAAISLVTDISSWCLVTAIAALGMKTSFRSLVEVGWRPVGLMVAETLWIAALVLLADRYLL